MYVAKAFRFLQGVKCPYCEKEILINDVSPFTLFSAECLSNHSSSSECSAINRLLAIKIHAYENGRMSEGDFNLWLKKFKDV